jgi:putative peptide zinc metalloprotease protein
MEYYNTYVPKIQNNVDIHSIGNNEYLVQQKEFGYNLKINELTYILLSLIDGKKNIEEIAFECKNIKKNITVDLIYNLITTTLVKYGVVYDENYVVERKKRERHLFVSFIFINSYLTDLISNILKYLFSPILFWCLFISTAIFNFYLIIKYLSIYKENSDTLFSGIFIYYIIIFFLLDIFHEFGHASAGRYFDIKSKGIGFGFYLFIPTFFSDMSNAWRLDVKKRILINIGGIYFDFIASSAFLIIFLFTNNIYYFIVSTMVIISVLYNLNCLVRYDGYWILSDLLHIPNLYKVAHNKFENLITSIYNKKAIELSLKDVFLITYSIISRIYIVIIISIILLMDANKIVTYPIDLFDLLVRYCNNGEVKIKDMIPFIIPTLFYLILIKKFVYYIVKCCK